MYDLTVAQHKRGHNLTVITRACKGDLEYDSQLPFKVIRVSSTSLLHFGWKAINVAQRLQKPPEIVHTHGPAAIPFLLNRKRYGPRLVHSVHAVRKYQYSLYHRYLREKRIPGYPSPIKFSAFYPNIFREYVFEQLICRKSDHLVLVTRFFADQLRKYYKISPAKMTTVYNGSPFYPTEKDFADNPHGSHGGNETRTILFVGRFDWHKRIELLIDAMPVVMRSHPYVRLVLIGDGMMKGCMTERLCSLDYSDKILFAGWVDSKRVLSYYTEADCVCLPSISEGLPKVLLEAMGMKVPVISAANLAGRELLRNGDYGRLVEDATPEAWGLAINKVLARGPEVREKITRSADLIDKVYRWHHVAERIDLAYEKVLQS
ncbi:MAG: glycosyltransferase family 4 protein [Desulfobacteraceae bacterium]|nr:glycosyltransferase family 4 protein [Desulfobacteraceae bacterium]